MRVRVKGSYVNILATEDEDRLVTADDPPAWY